MLARGSRRAAAIASALLIGATATLTPALAADAAAPRSAVATPYSFQSRVWSSGGFKWSFRGYKNGNYASLTVDAFRRAATGYRPTQSYEWQFYGLAGSDLKIASTLASASIDSGAAMGAYGSVKMHLRKPSAVHKRVQKCRKTGDILSRTYSRSGSFVGSFAFKTNAPGLPSSVKTSAVGITVSQTVQTGKACPATGSCTEPAHLFNGLHYDGATGITDWVQAARDGKFSYIRLDTSRQDATNQVTIDAEIASLLPPAAVVIGISAVTLTGGALAPFGGGVLKLTTQASTTDVLKHCTKTTIDELYQSGKIIGKFATGNFNFDTFDSPYATITKKL
jgi:hypothetical protein